MYYLYLIRLVKEKRENNSISTPSQIISSLSASVTDNNIVGSS